MIDTVFERVILIGPFRISADNYHAVDDSALFVYKTAGVVGSRRVKCVWRKQNAPRSPGMLCHAHSKNYLCTLLPMVESSMDSPTYNRGLPIFISYIWIYIFSKFTSKLNQMHRKRIKDNNFCFAVMLSGNFFKILADQLPPLLILYIIHYTWQSSYIPVVVAGIH